MNQRLLQFLKVENITQSQFADTIGVARASVSHILAGRNKPGFDFLESMARHYPALNISWLITGKGKMYSAPQGIPDLFPKTESNTLFPALQEDSNEIYEDPDSSLNESLAINQIPEDSPAGQPSIYETARNEGNSPAGRTEPAARSVTAGVPGKTTAVGNTRRTALGKTSDTTKNEKLISKIVVFYSDNTFEEFASSK